eukprot:1073544-Alexandrium_andersonii.AAC.1
MAPPRREAQRAKRERHMCRLSVARQMCTLNAQANSAINACELCVQSTRGTLYESYVCTVSVRMNVQAMCAI